MYQLIFGRHQAPAKGAEPQELEMVCASPEDGPEVNGESEMLTNEANSEQPALPTSVDHQQDAEASEDPATKEHGSPSD